MKLCLNFSYKRYFYTAFIVMFWNLKTVFFLKVTKISHKYVLQKLETAEHLYIQNLLFETQTQ